MSEGADEKNDKGERAALAMRQLAVAAIAAPAASPASKQVAHAALAELLLEQGSPAREHETIAAAFNRQLDAVLDAANASHGARERATRRVQMTWALAAAGLVLLDADELARLVTARD